MDPKNNRLVLTVLSAICVVLIGVTSIKNTWLAPLRAGVGFILTPIQVGVNTAGKSLYNSIEQHEKLKSALEDNSKLQEKIEELRSENTRLEEATYELSRLRELYKLNTEYEKYNFVGARIIAKDSSGWFRVFRIDKGSADGIKVDMNVMASGGLVGIVTDVGSNYATVRSIIDDLSRVSAMAVQSGDNCIVAGDLKLYQEGKLKLSDIRANADIKDGDKIVTSLGERMRRRIANIVLMIIFFAIQSCIFPFIPFLAGSPNFMVILVFTYGFIYGEREGIFYGVFAGILMDLFYSNAFGIFTLIFIWMGFINGKFSRYFYEDYIILPVSLCAINEVVYNFVIYVVRFYIRGKTDIFFYVRTIVLPEMIATMLCTLLLYRLLLEYNRRWKAIDDKRGKESA